MDRDEYESRLVDALTDACDLLGDGGTCPCTRGFACPLGEDASEMCDGTNANVAACWLLNLMKWEGEL